jgi:hypothetical protein
MSFTELQAVADELELDKEEYAEVDRVSLLDLILAELINYVPMSSGDVTFTKLGE